MTSQLITAKFITPESNPQYFQWQNDIRPTVKKLYAYGNLDLLTRTPRIGIVGSRTISPYGLQILKIIVPTLVQNKITIVSGGAFGVDFHSQNIALNFNGQVITVLGSGIDNPSPRTNLNFFKQVATRGLLLSEEPSQTPATKYSFVKRNRIIAALSDLLLVVEARAKSGALITADYALEQGKPICCFPGRVYDYLAQGTNQLIKSGAFLVESADDILDLLQSH